MNNLEKQSRRKGEFLTLTECTNCGFVIPYWTNFDPIKEGLDDVVCLDCMEEDSLIVFRDFHLLGLPTLHANGRLHTNKDLPTIHYH